MKNYIEQLNKLSTTNLSDAMDKLGLDGVLDDIKCVTNTTGLIIGKAITVQLTEKEIKNPMHLGINAVQIAHSDSIIIISNEGRTSMACWGGILSTAAVKKGIKGVIIDGKCRDIEEINNLKLPVFSRGIAVRSARNRVYQKAVNENISINGITISLDDIIVADDNGVIVIAQEQKNNVIQEAKIIAKLENEMIDKIQSGIPIENVDKENKYNQILELKD